MLMNANNSETVSAIETALHKIESVFSSGNVCTVAALLQANGLHCNFSRILQVVGILQKSQKSTCNRGWTWTAQTAVSYSMAEAVWECYKAYIRCSMTGRNYQRRTDAKGVSHFVQVQPGEKGFITFEQWAKKKGYTFPDFSKAPKHEEPKAPKSPYVTHDDLAMFKKELLGELSKMLERV